MGMKSIQDERENSAAPRLNKRDQWIVQLIQIDRKIPKFNVTCNFTKMIEVMNIGMEDRFMRKRNTSL